MISVRPVLQYHWLLKGHLKTNSSQELGLESLSDGRWFREPTIQLHITKT